VEPAVAAVAVPAVLAVPAAVSAVPGLVLVLVPQPAPARRPGTPHRAGASRTVILDTRRAIIH
jgi:hypothetical protein